MIPVETLTVVGVGLIGGSVGLAAKTRGAAKHERNENLGHPVPPPAAEGRLLLIEPERVCVVPVHLDHELGARQPGNGERQEPARERVVGDDEVVATSSVMANSCESQQVRCENQVSEMIHVPDTLRKVEADQLESAEPDVSPLLAVHDGEHVTGEPLRKTLELPRERGLVRREVGTDVNA